MAVRCSASRRAPSRSRSTSRRSRTRSTAPDSPRSMSGVALIPPALDQLDDDEPIDAEIVDEDYYVPPAHLAADGAARRVLGAEPSPNEAAEGPAAYPTGRASAGDCRCGEPHARCLRRPLIEDAQSQGWSLVVLDINVDPTTSSGKLIAQVLSSFAEYERAQISERSKAGLTAKKRRGERIGRPGSHRWESCGASCSTATRACASTRSPSH
jgi:Resolvase, N terminal domain